MAEDLRAKAVGGTKWVLLTNYSLQAVGLSSRFVLSWLLFPEDWGLVAAAMLVITIVRSCGNFGVNYALVHRRDRIEEATQTGLVLLLVLSALTYVVVIAVAPFTSGYFKNAAVPLLTKVLALSLLVRAPSVVVEGTLRKEFQLRRIFVIETVSYLLSAAAAIATAALLPREQRYWALVVGGLGRETLRSIFSWALANVPLKLRFDWQVAKDLLNYGKYFVGSSIFMVLYLNLDRLVLGRIGSTLELGLYAFALGWVSKLGIESARVFGGVALPLYAKLQDDTERLRSVYCRILSYTALLSIGLLGGMISVISEAVHLALPERYHVTVLTFQVLGFYYIIRANDNTSGTLYAAIGKPNYDMYLNALNFGVMAVLMVPFVQHLGPVGAALAVVVARLARMAANAVLCMRALRCPLARLLDSLLPAAKAALAMMGTLWAVKAAAAHAGMSIGWVGLGALIGLGGATYIGVLYLFHRALVFEVIGLMRDALLPRKAKANAS